MYIDFVDNVFFADSVYAEKDDLRGAGFRWNAEKKKWWTDNAENAKKLLQFCSEKAKGVI